MKGMRPIRHVSFIILGLWFAGATSHSFAQGDFYEGKTIRIIVGLAAGGGYDVYARTIARHMGKHIPGSPAISVDNMTGAGQLARGQSSLQSGQARRADDRPFYRRAVPAPTAGQTGHRIRCAQIRIHRHADAG